MFITSSAWFVLIDTVVPPFETASVFTICFRNKTQDNMILEYISRITIVISVKLLIFIGK